MSVSWVVACFIALLVIVFPAPSFAAKVRIDSDRDGLQDKDERIYRTDPLNPDSDADSFRDGIEVRNAYDPLDVKPYKLKKRIEVSLSKQRLTYFFGKTPVRTVPVSSGKWGTPTPMGEFQIINKHPRAWSRLAALWMPYWMGFAGGKYGIHELPEWPGGKKEGENHLGVPVSHGCIRVGVGEAKRLYDWTPVGTKLIIRK